MEFGLRLDGDSQFASDVKRRRISPALLDGLGQKFQAVVVLGLNTSLNSMG